MRALLLFAIGLIFGTGFGYLASGSFQMDGHAHGDHDTAMEGEADHDHAGHADPAHDHAALIDWPVQTAQPRLSLQILPDSPTSRNLHIIADGFDWTPEQVNNDVSPGGGHAHVYLNGQKVARAYGPWLHIDSWPEGTVTVRVTFNANDHSGWAVDGQPLAIEQVVE